MKKNKRKNTNTNLCKICKSKITGRQDKIFCSIECKNSYHVKLRKVTHKATKKVDTVLHRNRSILLEIMGKNAKQKKVSKLIVDRKKFNYTYVTSYHLNNQGKMVNHVYDFSWMIFSDEEILIKRKNQTRRK